MCYHNVQWQLNGTKPEDSNGCGFVWTPAGWQMNISGSRRHRTKLYATSTSSTCNQV